MSRIASWILLGALATGPVGAEQTRRWLEPAESLALGEADGVAVSAGGSLQPAPRISRLGSGATPGEPGHAWALARDRQGNLYLGTGPDGLVLQIAPDGRQTIYYRTGDPMVTALAIDSDGSLLAATAPEGKIYRIDARGSGSLWCETGERYVWSLLVARDGSVYAATGEHGRILRISRDGRSSIWFDGDEAHITQLIELDDGTLVAGGGSRGLVYRFDADGHGFVVHDDPLPEVSGLAVAPDGQLLATFVALPEPEDERPTLRLRLPEGARVGAATENAGSLEERTGPTLRGEIEGLPDAEPPASRPVRGRLLRLGPEGEAETLWSSTDEAPFDLQVDRSGAALFVTGEPARLYRVDDRGDVTLLATLPEAQATRLLTAERLTHLATSNPARLYRVESRVTAAGSFVSRPFDAGAAARWGSIHWSVLGPSGARPEIYTRTGSSREPDGTWSAWSPAQLDGTGSPIDNPDGRFLQWRVRFGGAGATGTRVSGVRFSFAPFNRAPEFESGAEVDRRWASERVVWTWRTLDRDGDPVRTGVEVRPRGSAEFVRIESRPLDDGPTRPIREHRATWEVGPVAEGSWEARLWVSDHGSNAPGDGRRVERALTDVVIDRTPPSIDRTSGGGAQSSWTVRDALSPVDRVEWIVDGEVLHTLRPLDGVCDSREERFPAFSGQPGVAGTLRAVDAAGNETRLELPAAVR